jgi:hypothetical protein
MTNPYKDKPWFKFLSNKYGFCCFFLSYFLDNYSYFGHRVLDKQINELEDNAHYKEKKKDQKNIKQLKNRTDRKKYLREYYMKKR